MNRFVVIVFVLLASAAWAGQAHAQVLNWTVKYPKEGGTSGTILVQGTADLSKNITSVNVYVCKNGFAAKKHNLKVDDVTGLWGGKDGTEVAAPAGTYKNGEVLIVTVIADGTGGPFFLTAVQASKK